MRCLYTHLVLTCDMGGLATVLWGSRITPCAVNVDRKESSYQILCQYRMTIFGSAVAEPADMSRGLHQTGSGPTLRTELFWQPLVKREANSGLSVWGDRWLPPPPPTPTILNMRRANLLFRNEVMSGLRKTNLTIEVNFYIWEDQQSNLL
jgi:hypothetical protein